MFNDRKFVVIAAGMILIWLFAMTMMKLPWLIETWPRTSALLCKGEDCSLQGWLGALSGWAAFAAAVYTFRYLRVQINEQKRQTDFIIGNEDPTLDSVQHLKDPEEIVLRLVNWNRRGILIHDVDFLDRDWLTGIMEAKIDNKVVDDLVMPIFLRGWEDRNNEGPRVVQFSLSAHERNASALIKDWPKGQEVFADIQILGERHASKRLICFLPD